jgi:hypothetical protein
MPSSPKKHSAIIWQGYHHEWEYNHRINRMGSYVAQKKDKDGTNQTVVGHTAASGTGNDTAHFKDFVTEVRSAEGVAFQSGYAETEVECQRGDLTPFVICIDDLELSPELQGCDTYTVVLNGFDIYALQHSEKIITFDIDVTEPTLNADGTKARLYIVGHLRFDCRSPECQLLPVRLESEAIHKTDMVEENGNPGEQPLLPPKRPKRGLDRHKFDKAAHWFKRQMVTLMGVEDVKRSLADRDEDSTRRRLFRFLGRRFFLRFLKWELSAPYVIRVHYLLIGGKREAFATCETAPVEHTYHWDLEHEIQRESKGVVPIAIPADDVTTYTFNTLAFRQLWLDITIDETLGTEDPIQWGKGMHLLEWSMAIRDIVTSENNIQAKLDLFYRCWSEAMNEVITFTTWGAVRGAGSARIGARLALLQFKNAEACTQLAMPGRIYWPGGGRSATSDPRARFERPVGALLEEC